METPAVSGPSERVRVAVLARETALATPGVVDLDSGPTGRFATVGGGTRVAGVTSAAAPGGGYDVGLRLTCELVRLPPLADKVRAAVIAAAHRHELTIDTVDVEVVDVADAAGA